MDPQYAYYAIVSLARPVDDPFTVVRTPVGGDYEEVLSTDLEWVRSDYLYRIKSGRDYFEAVPISEEAGKGFEEVQARRVEEVRRRQAE